MMKYSLVMSFVCLSGLAIATDTVANTNKTFFLATMFTLVTIFSLKVAKL